MANTVWTEEDDRLLAGAVEWYHQYGGFPDSSYLDVLVQPVPPPKADYFAWNPEAKSEIFSDNYPQPFTHRVVGYIVRSVCAFVGWLLRL